METTNRYHQKNSVRQATVTVWPIPNSLLVQRLGVEQNQFPSEPTGTSSGNRQRDGNSHDSGTSRATTASQRPSFRTPWRMVGSGKAGWTTSKSGRPCPMPQRLAKTSRRKGWKRISAAKSSSMTSLPSTLPSPSPPPQTPRMT